MDKNTLIDFITIIAVVFLGFIILLGINTYKAIKLEQIKVQACTIQIESL